jgi:hypothetical protein
MSELPDDVNPIVATDVKNDEDSVYALLSVVVDPPLSSANILFTTEL